VDLGDQKEKGRTLPPPDEPKPSGAPSTTHRSFLAVVMNGVFVKPQRKFSVLEV
jgi:hypothetical protein